MKNKILKHMPAVLAVAMVGGLVFAGCKKEEPLTPNSQNGWTGNGFRFTTEGSAKTTVDGLDVYWVEGDEIALNGTKQEIVINNDNYSQGEVNGFSSDGVSKFVAFYPASYLANESATETSATSISYNMPNTYSYSETNGRQQLALPMVGQVSDEGATSMTLYHLSSCLNLKIRNSMGQPLVLKNITLSTTDAVPLCGAASVALQDFDETHTPVISTSSTSKSVTMRFNEAGAMRVSIDTGATKEIQIPLMPSTTAYTLKIKIETNLTNVEGVAKFAPTTAFLNYEYELAGSTPGRAKVKSYLANFSMGNGRTKTNVYHFTVNGNGKTVLFSKGNLQYQASSSTWKFADNQYAFVGNAAGNTTAEANRATQSDWIDLYGWGTSGNNHGAHAYQPYAISNSDADYYAYNSSLLNLYDNDGSADWGSNTIAGTTGKWRTLNQAEWVYLLNNRTGNQVAHSWMKATLVRAANDTTNGIILFPDGYSFGNNDATILGLITNYDAQDDAIWAGSTAWADVAKISSANWNTLQNAGCVFLPASGFRTGLTVKNGGRGGNYWSSSASDASDARYVAFSADAVLPQNSYNRMLGFSVRLVQEY